MFRSLWVFIIISILISACVPALKAAPQPDQPTTTSSPLPTATPTRTVLPSATPTTSITSLPTIPTFTPTFDVSTIVTVTPAPKATICPKEDSSVKKDFKFPHSLEDMDDPSFTITDDQILSYLNSGGRISSVMDDLISTTVSWGVYAYQDFTGDNVKELLIQLFGYPTGYSHIYIYVCANGRYKEFWINQKEGALRGASIIAIKDMNKNGMVDLALNYGDSSAIYEWDGLSFKDISKDAETNKWIFLNSQSRKPEVKDINSDGLYELVLTGADIFYYGDNSYYYGGIPWRDELRIYAWDGKIFSQLPVEYLSAEFRFQASQDGDRFTLQKQYEKAMTSYQDVIFNDKLQWWGPEMHTYEMGIPSALWNSQPTPTPPAPDATEYPRLAAYAYYRIMLLHLVQGHEADATTVYNTLQEKFGNDQYGRPYVDMATAFWNAYQSTHTMYDGCAAAIEYAAKHPDILTPLGSDYHGAQSHTYKPEDVCPFR